MQRLGLAGHVPADLVFVEGDLGKLLNVAIGSGQASRQDALLDGEV